MKQIVKHYNGFLADITHAVNKTLEDNKNYAIASFQIIESNARYQSLFVFNIIEDDEDTQTWWLKESNEATKDVDTDIEDKSLSSSIEKNEEYIKMVVDMSNAIDNAEQNDTSKEVDYEVQQIVDSDEVVDAKPKRRRRHSTEN